MHAGNGWLQRMHGTRAVGTVTRPGAAVMNVHRAAEQLGFRWGARVVHRPKSRVALEALAPGPVGFCQKCRREFFVPFGMHLATCRGEQSEESEPPAR